VNLFRRHGSEVHVATAPLRVTLATGAAGGLAGLEASGANAARAIAPGDWIVRMDQPYTATVRTLLSLQRYKPTTRRRTTTPAGRSTRCAASRRSPSPTRRCSRWP
jgi:sarcosine oxidase gamma subunit